MPGDQKEAIHSLDKKNHQRGRNVEVNIGDFTEWVEEDGDLRKMYYLLR